MNTNRQPSLEYRQEFERRALHGLMCEWKLAVSNLPQHLRGLMRPPTFVMNDFTNLWGKWAGVTREIAMARRLFWEYPWVAARDVLRHEMAHQMADEVWPGDSTPHGDMFRRACALLHADPDAGGDYAPLSDALRQGELSRDDRILLRIKKLLALAQSANRHEAEAAMAKVHEHITRYNVDLRATACDRTYRSACVGRPAVRRPAHDSELACLLSDFYFVESIWISTYVLEKGRMGSILEISGTPENVKMAGYVYDFLKRVIEEQWSAFNAGGHLSQHRKTDFAVGLVRGFRQKLETQERQWQATGESSWALIKAGDTLLREYFRHRYPRIRRTSGWSRLVDASVQKAGEKAGQATVLSKPIESTTGGKRLLLGG